MDETKFGAGGISDPVLFHPGLDAIKRKVDFSAVNLSKDEAYALFGLPKAFVVTGIFVEETKKCSAAATLTLKAGTTTLGEAVNVGGSTLARTAKLGTAAVLNEGSVVSLTANSAIIDGVANIVVYGYTPYGDSLGNIVTPDYRESGQTQTNVAGIDPWQEAAVRRG